MLQRIIGDDVSVGVRFGQSLAPVEADRAQIERVVLNLAANARDAMPRGGRLTIETSDVVLDELRPLGLGALALGDVGVGADEAAVRHRIAAHVDVGAVAARLTATKRSVSAS